MLCETIDLYRYFGLEKQEGREGILTTYVPHSIENELRPKFRPGMLVIPGGGYRMRSDREKEPVALAYLKEGYCAFTLDYSVSTAYPAPLIEACMAMIYLRENAAKYHLDPAHLAAIGFSAGGHLAGMLSMLYEEPEIVSVLGERAKNARPDAVVLSYPVITMGERTHGGTRDVITGGREELLQRLSLENRVSKKAAPAFLWHTQEDDCVPVENSLLLAAAYRKAGVPFAMHIFEHGPHGLSLISPETNDQTEYDTQLAPVGKWLPLSLDWLKSRGFSVRPRD
ncbi:MAG TPA: alpha/beta hydrolase [Candidatus Gallimonas intestinavium]|uniref:Alpha/beta hydrolase n=1 Tax=Candidatus Gallimonas intestinavium TaxID=2838603 RepID=A0A9D2G6W6_9FIRM|nr:alpha/beta hydrolase [Candidatus Gallimonas intestinavium]